jgi:hypothetical protein
LLELLLFLGAGACANYSPIPPDWVVYRSAGRWVAAGSAPAGFERLSIQVLSVTPREGDGFETGVPYATGTVSWAGHPSSVVFQVGTPNKPGTPMIWVTESEAGGLGQPFAFDIQVQGRTADVAKSDPGRDHMFVEFGDGPTESWYDRAIAYERDP